MSSLFHEAEEQLTRLGLAAVRGEELDVLVGGLGLGYTAAAVLASPRVTRLVVVEALEPVISWHRLGLVPLGPVLTGDARCVLHHADFFAGARGEGFDPEGHPRQFDTILLDIDHTPDHRLHPDHGDFYTTEGLVRLARHLKTGGIFALWSDEAPDARFLAVLASVFTEVSGHEVVFDNPLTRSTSVNGIYRARKT